MFDGIRDAATAFLERFKAHPAVRAIVLELEREECEQRRQCVAAIAKLRDDQAAALAPFAKRIDAAAGELAEIERRRTKALGRLLALTAERDAVATRFDGQITRLERQLERTADVRLAEFCDDMNELLSKTRGLASTTVSNGTEYWSGRRDKDVSTNAPAVREKIDAIRAAIARARAMRTEAIPNLTDVLQGMRAEIDAIDTREVSWAVLTRPEGLAPARAR